MVDYIKMYGDAVDGLDDALFDDVPFEGMNEAIVREVARVLVRDNEPLEEIQKVLEQSSWGKENVGLINEVVRQAHEQTVLDYKKMYGALVERIDDEFYENMPLDNMLEVMAKEVARLLLVDGVAFDDVVKVLGESTWGKAQGQDVVSDMVFAIGKDVDVESLVVNDLSLDMIVDYKKMYDDEVDRVDDDVPMDGMGEEVMKCKGVSGKYSGIWENEKKFSAWLTEHIDCLYNIIGIDMEVIIPEAHAGKYRADILAVEKISKCKIIIENQFNDKHHSHLGQILTYASIHDAEFIIWIVSKMTEEHEHAVRWLNKNMPKRINFFILQVSCSRSKEPEFKVIVQPDMWSKSKASGFGLRREAFQCDKFLHEFMAFLELKKSILRVDCLRHQHKECRYFEIPKWSEATIKVEVSEYFSNISCSVVIEDIRHYNKLNDKYKEQINKKNIEKLTWSTSTRKRDSKEIGKIAAFQNIIDIDFNNQDKWSSRFNWMQETAEKFYDVFLKYRDEVK